MMNHPSLQQWYDEQTDNRPDKEELETAMLQEFEPSNADDLLDVEVSRDGQTWEFWMTTTRRDWALDTMGFYNQKEFGSARVKPHSNQLTLL